MRLAQPMPWREALMEALGLGLFMVVAGVCGTVLEFPGSPIHRALPNAVLRRLLMGVVIGRMQALMASRRWCRGQTI